MSDSVYRRPHVPHTASAVLLFCIIETRRQGSSFGVPEEVTVFSTRGSSYGEGNFPNADAWHGRESRQARQLVSCKTLGQILICKSSGSEMQFTRN